jgi:hypothetical protein
MMGYVFDELKYSNTTGAMGEFHPDDLHSLATLRRFYPELITWGNLALYLAWESYSDAVHLTGWQNVVERDLVFLDYLCWEQNRGSWSWGADRQDLVQMRVTWSKGALWCWFRVTHLQEVM